MISLHFHALVFVVPQTIPSLAKWESEQRYQSLTGLVSCVVRWSWSTTGRYVVVAMDTGGAWVALAETIEIMRIVGRWSQAWNQEAKADALGLLRSMVVLVGRLLRTMVDRGYDSDIDTYGSSDRDISRKHEAGDWIWSDYGGSAVGDWMASNIK